MSEEAAASGQALLVVANPSGHSKRVPLGKVPFFIGRQSDNDVVIRDNRTSRRHAQIMVEDGDYYVENLKSRHGIYVNDEKVERHRLTGGDVITFGVEDSYQLTFHLEEGELNRLLGQFPTPSKLASGGAANLAKLRAMIEVARALQSSLTTEEVLDAVVDAALTV
ncbi:MAG: FHA domain-containing protein, partial [bacterium]|nr:FHA domain-containing protein [bacterium]